MNFSKNMPKLIQKIYVSQNWMMGFFFSEGKPFSMFSCKMSNQSIDHGTKIQTGWWFGTFFIFPYIGNNHPNWLIFFRGVQTTNQQMFVFFPSDEFQWTSVRSLAAGLSLWNSRCTEDHIRARLRGSELQGCCQGLKVQTQQPAKAGRFVIREERLGTAGGWLGRETGMKLIVFASPPP